MKLSGFKKILLLGITLLIVAGIVVVALRGINVSLILQKHDAINLLVGKEVSITDIENICREVFGDKKVIIRKLELFNDSVNIVAESITDEEKTNLINKINEKYQTEFTVENTEVQTISNIRVRDLIRPYIRPFVISLLVILTYILIRFRKKNILKILLKTFFVVVLTEALLASIIAITRIPLVPIMINLMAIIAVIELVIIIGNLEKSSNVNQ